MVEIFQRLLVSLQVAEYETCALLWKMRSRLPFVVFKRRSHLLLLHFPLNQFNCKHIEYINISSTSLITWSRTVESCSPWRLRALVKCYLLAFKSVFSLWLCLMGPMGPMGPISPILAIWCWFLRRVAPLNSEKNKQNKKTWNNFEAESWTGDVIKIKRS